MMMRLLGRVLGEPLVHFVVLGSALFGLHALLARAPQPDGQVTVTPARIADLREKFALQWRRPPSDAELDGLVRDDVREEMLYREALRLGLDRDDVIVRRRLAQKMEFLAGEVADTVRPGDDELDTYLRAHAERYREPERASFTQILVRPDRHGADAEGVARALLVRLDSEPLAPERSTDLGDASLLDATYDRLSQAEIGRIFGDDFARELFALAPGQWHGPLRSEYGLHLIRVGERAAGQMPALAEIRSRVEADWRRDRRDEADARFLTRLQDSYPEVRARDGARP
jgi:hypothetical protein